MRLFAIVFLNFLFSATVFAQYCPPLSGKLGEKKLFHITAGYGVTKIYGDVGGNDAYSSAGTISFDYQVKKGLLLGIEGQFGSLITKVSNFSQPRQSLNEYSAFGARVTFHPFSYFSTKKYLRSYGDVFWNLYM